MIVTIAFTIIVTVMNVGTVVVRYSCASLPAPSSMTTLPAGRLTPEQCLQQERADRQVWYVQAHTFSPFFSVPALCFLDPKPKTRYPNKAAWYEPTGMVLQQPPAAEVP